MLSPTVERAFRAAMDYAFLHFLAATTDTGRTLWMQRYIGYYRMRAARRRQHQ